MKRLLIRAEDKNKWERRVPLIPADVRTLIMNTTSDVYIEKSDKRFFKDTDYVDAGAKLTTNMNPGEVIFGVKEIPENKILHNKVYVFFTHTIKRQKENMPMLKRIIESGSTLIDYERITDAHNRRQIYFGNFAGHAGVINIFWLMGEYWKNKNINTPFSDCKQALNYFSVDEAKDHFIQIGERIKREGLPQSISPLTVAMLGYGNVSEGAQSILNCLPVIQVKPNDFKFVLENKRYDCNHIYIAVFKEEDLVKSKLDDKFNLQEYYHMPNKYEANFSQYLPYISIIINATYWDQRYPRFVTWDALRELYETQPNPKLQGIADITCDINGSIECNVKTTDSGMPAYRVNPITKKILDGHKGDGLVLLAVDNLPAELPNDSSVFFSNQLKNYVPNILEADYHSSLEESGLYPNIKNAVIVYNGKLTQNYSYLQENL